jgi:hypothetical protein
VVTSLAVDLEKSEIFKHLSKFKQVKINVSFENAGDRYNYVRHNASWDVLVKNIETILTMENITLGVDSIYSIYNATDLLNFYRFISKYNLKARWFRVHSPTALDITLFEPAVKEMAIKEIDQLLVEFAHYSDFDFFKTIRNSLINSDTKNIDNFIKFTDNLENNQQKNKKHTFFELWPEFNFMRI